MVYEGLVNKNQAQVIIISSKLPMQCKDNFVIFYIKWFWKILYIYIKQMTRFRYST